MSQKLSTPARLEAFSDGVIAVIITIMVLELKVPRQDGFDGLRAILPTLLVYALSFSLTGIYWINHRHLIDSIDGRLQHIAEAILYANLLLLFCLSLIPFFTAYMLAKHLDSFSVALYAVSNVVSGLAFLLLRFTVVRRLHAAHRLSSRDTANRPKDIVSIVAYLAAIPVAFVHPYLALLLLAAVSLVWIVPTVGVHDAGANEGQTS